MGLQWTVVSIQSADSVEIERDGVILPFSAWDLELLADSENLLDQKNTAGAANKAPRRHFTAES